MVTWWLHTPAGAQARPGRSACLQRGASCAPAEVVTRWLHGGYTVVTRWLHGGGGTVSYRYATFCRLGGLSEAQCADAPGGGVPPTDAVDLWPAVLGGGWPAGGAGRSEVPLAFCSEVLEITPRSRCTYDLGEVDS